jgi:hypothetical protein
MFIFVGIYILIMKYIAQQVYVYTYTPSEHEQPLWTITIIYPYVFFVIYLTLIVLVHKSVKVLPKYCFAFVRSLQLFFSLFIAFLFIPALVVIISSNSPFLTFTRIPLRFVLGLIFSPVFALSYFVLSNLSFEAKNKDLPRKKRVLLFFYGIITLTFVIPIAFSILESFFIVIFETSMPHLY